MNRVLVNRLSKPMLVIGAVGMVLVAMSTVSHAQNGNAFFDFEGGVVGALPAGPDRYILQGVGGGTTGVTITPGLLIQTAQDGAVAVGNNGPFEDLLGAPGNKSAVWDNNDHFQVDVPTPDRPDGPTNATMGFGAGVWNANAANFTNGRVEYDIYLQPAPAGGSTFMENRIGFGLNDGFVSTVNDTTVRYSLADTASGPRIRYDGLGNLLTTSAQPLVGATNHVIVDILPNKTHTITLNGTLIEWITPGGPVSALPWVDPAATGVNEMTFVTGFAAKPAPDQGLVFIDNVRITNRIPEPAAGALALLGAAALAIRRRVAKA